VLLASRSPYKGLETAAPFLAETGQVGNDGSHKKLIAYMGLDPSLHQSGKFIGTKFSEGNHQ
jgi:transposase